MNAEGVGDRASPGHPRVSDGPLTGSSLPPTSLPDHQAHLRGRGRLPLRSVAYFIGLLIILAALAWAAMLLGVPEAWIGVGLLFGLGVTLIKGARHTPHLR